MQNYRIEIYDIKDIVKPVKIEELILEVKDTDGKFEVIDKAHDIAYEKFPNIKRMVQVHRIL